MNQTPSNSAVSTDANPRQFADINDFLQNFDYGNPEKWNFPEAGQIDAIQREDRFVLDLSIFEEQEMDNDNREVGDFSEAAQLDDYDLEQIDISLLEEQEMDVEQDIQTIEVRDEEPDYRNPEEGDFPEAAQMDAIEEDLFDYDLNQIDMSFLEDQEMEVHDDLQVTEAPNEELDLPLEVNPIELAKNCLKRKPEEEEIFVDQEDNQAIESQVEEQIPQESSFINESCIQEPQESEEPKDVHWFSRRLFDLYLTCKYYPKMRVTSDACALLARYESLFDVLPEEERDILNMKVFAIHHEVASTEPPECPSRNPFELDGLLGRNHVTSYEDLFDKVKHLKVDARIMSQILWDFYDFYHVNQNPFL